MKSERRQTSLPHVCTCSHCASVSIDENNQGRDPEISSIEGKIILDLDGHAVMQSSEQKCSLDPHHGCTKFDTSFPHTE